MTSKKYAVFLLLIALLMLVPTIGLSCQEEESGKSPPSDRMGLSSTLVPDTDFDIYVYIKQESPTAVFRGIIGVPFDVNVLSMAIWGIATEETYALSGGLEFASPKEAADIHHQVSLETDIWTLHSLEMIYFAHGSGNAVDAVTSAISATRFKYYDNEVAMAELSLFPEGNMMKLIGVTIAEPSPALVDVIIRNIASDTADILDVILNTANLEIITAGLYTQYQIDISAIIKNPELANILTSQVGILACAKSAWPELMVEPIIREVLENAGFDETVEDEFIIYKGYLALGLDYDIPVFFRVEDNRLFMTVSSHESYAKLLISNIVN